VLVDQHKVWHQPGSRGYYLSPEHAP
jgi:hypothetical protein